MDRLFFQKLNKMETSEGLPAWSGQKGFTLIELLIVIAIILILIAIALPNFLEAQIRARVTKSKAEIRTIGIAMESYYLDWNVYPWESEDNCASPGLQRSRCGLAWLTNPIAYITSIPPDTFPNPNNEEESWMETGVVTASRPNPIDRAAATWALFTRGPDGIDSELTSADPEIVYREAGGDGSADNYSPTNGTKSRGDIFLFGGDGYFIGTICSPPLATKSNCQTIDPLVVDGLPYVHRLPPDSL